MATAENRSSDVGPSGRRAGMPPTMPSPRDCCNVQRHRDVDSLGPLIHPRHPSLARPSRMQYTRSEGRPLRIATLVVSFFWLPPSVRATPSSRSSRINVFQCGNTA